MTKLEKAQEEYIEFLTGQYRKAFAVAAMHNYEVNAKVFNKGVELRTNIKKSKL